MHYPCSQMGACAYRRGDRETASPVVIDKGEALLQEYTTQLPRYRWHPVETILVL